MTLNDLLELAGLEDPPGIKIIPRGADGVTFQTAYRSITVTHELIEDDAVLLARLRSALTELRQERKAP